MVSKPKILAPVGDFLSLRAALDAGCDEVYFGVRGLNMRAGARNFSISDLSKIGKLCKENKVRAFLAINTIIYESEMKKVDKILSAAKKAGIDAIIGWDMAVIERAVKLGFEIHLSTQASVSNYDALESYKKKIKKLKRIVLARECSLEDVIKIIKKIKKNKLGIEVETFIHGAMCASVSGRCFLSQELFNKSANRGECLQPCRRNYKTYLLKDPEEGHELLLGEDFVMSPNDLCTMDFIEQLIDAGIVSFKIEGRNRNPEYVSTVVSCYRTVIDYYADYKGKIKKSKKERVEYESLKKGLLKRLENVYYRGFSSGFFMGKPVNEWSGVYGSKAKEFKQYVGKVVNYYLKIGVAEIKVESYPVKKGEDIMFIGPTTGVIRQKLAGMQGEKGEIGNAKKGMIVTVKIKEKVRKNDLMYKIVKRS